MFVICMNKLSLKIMKNNEMTLLPTQYIKKYLKDDMHAKNYVQ